MNTIPEILNYGYVFGQRLHPHRNHGFELTLLESGHLEWQVDSRHESLYPGSLFFTLPWQVHGSRMIREPDNRQYYILIALPETAPPKKKLLQFPEFLNLTPQERRFISSAFLSTDVHTRTATPLAQTLFKELITELDQKQAANRPLCISLIKTLLIEIARIYTSSNKEDTAKWNTDQRVLKFMTELQTRIDEPWTLDSMADACRIKRSRIADITRRLTGYPPIKYLNRLRLESAQKMLKETKKSITDIAFDCGYSSSQYFAEQFKKQMKMTPTEFRQVGPELESILTALWDNPEDRSEEEEERRRIFLNEHTNFKH